MKKGFTLVELLAVIVILAVILVIAVPLVLQVVDNSRKEAYKRTEEMILSEASKYLVNNTHKLPTEIGGTSRLSISELQDANLISEIKDKRNRNINCDGYVLIRKVAASSYDYEPFLRCEDNYSTDGLIASYTFEGNAYDMTGNDYNGSSITNVVWEQDGPYNVARFDGSSFINVINFYNPNHSNPVFLGTSPSHPANFNGNSTYSAWVKPTQLDSTSRFVFSDHNYNEGYIAFRNDRIIGVWNGGNSITHLTSVQTNKWYHVSISHERDDNNNVYIFKFYIDGNLINTRSVNISSQSIYYGPDHRLVIGHEWIGLIDDIRIYERVLTDEEILNKYNKSNIGR